jgi:hypothetical protein
MEGLGQLKNPMTSSGIKPRYLPACSILPQAATDLINFILAAVILVVSFACVVQLPDKKVLVKLRYYSILFQHVSGLLMA